MKLTMLTPYDIYLGVMYRYESTRWSLGCDEFDNPYPGHNLTVDLRVYAITKRTAKGVWIDYYGQKKFVLNGSRKRFACETVELAKESFRRRKLKQRRILQAQIDDVNLALELVEARDSSPAGVHPDLAAR